MVDKSPEKINKMFDEISQKYDLMNFVMSFGLQKLIKKSFIKDITMPANATILDLCTGTGDLAFELNKNKNIKKIIGLDFSKKMLDIAKQKNTSNKIEFIEGDCTKLPFKDNTFDGITMGFGLRNIENYENTLLEIKRVLKPNGFFAHIDIFKGPKIINFLFDLYVKIMINIFKAQNQSYKYLLNSKNKFLSSEKLSKKIKSYGFKQIKTKSFAFSLIKADFFQL